MSKQIDLNSIKTWIPKLNTNVYLDSSDDKYYLVRSNDHKMSNILRTLKFSVPKETKLELDDYSYFVVSLIDGINSVESIAVKLENKYGDNANPLYERLLMFLEILEKQHKVIKFL